MEPFANNATEKDLSPTNDESTNCAAEGVVNEMLGLLVNGAVDKSLKTSTSVGDGTGDETKRQFHDGVKYEWTDITNEFVSACSSLELGELVHDSKYVLESVFKV